MAKPLAPHLQRVLRLLIQGFSHQEIAQELTYSKSTVDTYVKRLRQFFADTPELQDPRLSRITALILAGTRYLETVPGSPVSERSSVEAVLERLGFSIPLSQLSQEEYSHIDPARREEVWSHAAQMVNNLAPLEERDRLHLRQIKSLSALDDKVLGLNTYVDHETDHAVMLLLEWLPRGDPSRWKDLRQNLDRLMDIICRETREANSELRTLRVLNTLLCYVHRFGPPALSDQAMRCAINLWDSQRDLTAAYVFRDLLQCDAFLTHPMAAERFYDFLGGVLRASPHATTNSSDRVMPGLEILYFSPAVWTYQQQILDYQLLPDPSQTRPSDLAHVLSQILVHLKEPGLPALSTANYLTDCIKLGRSDPRVLFQIVINTDLIDDMMAVVSAPLPASFRGIPLLSEIWREATRCFERMGRARASSEATFVAEMTGQWN